MIFRSNKLEARQFQDWVFNEVLPSIRKTGQYQAPNYITNDDMKTSNVLFGTVLHTLIMKMLLVVRHGHLYVMQPISQALNNLKLNNCLY